MFSKLFRAHVGALAALLISLPAWSDPPPESGIVSRMLVEDEFFVIFYFPDGDLSHFLGVDVVGLCTGLPADRAIGDYSVQQVLVDDQGGDLDRIVYRNTAEGYAGVWPGNVIPDDSDPLYFETLCTNVLSIPPVAEGTVKWRYRDNDINWFNECDLNGTPNKNVNSWGFSFNGVLEDYFGQPTQYSGQFGAVWKECDPSTFRERAHIQLKGYTN